MLTLQWCLGTSRTMFRTWLHQVCVCTHMQIAPTRMRGALGALNQLVICIGILSVLCVNVALPVTQWRTFFLLGAVPAVLLFLGRPTVLPVTAGVFTPDPCEHAPPANILLDDCLACMYPGMLRAPESPRWLLATGAHASAEAAARKLWGPSGAGLELGSAGAGEKTLQGRCRVDCRPLADIVCQLTS
jgi:hypothetical protein